MNDPFRNRTLSLSGPARDVVPVTPDDSNDLPNIAIALYVEAGGSVAFTTVAGNNRTVKVGNFYILPIGARRVFATGTTATGIHAMVLQ